MAAMDASRILTKERLRYEEQFLKRLLKLVKAEKTDEAIDEIKERLEIVKGCLSTQ